MLELVQRPIAFNPERELAKIAMKRGWPIVVERKNVVYKLSADSWKI
jgi:phosphoserine phosphatase